jgi:hypothetical protein
MSGEPFESETSPVPSKSSKRTARSANKSAPAEPPCVESEPGARPEEIARGRALAADPDYPSDESLAKLAELFIEDACRGK